MRAGVGAYQCFTFITVDKFANSLYCNINAFELIKDALDAIFIIV